MANGARAVTIRDRPGGANSAAGFATPVRSRTIFSGSIRNLLAVRCSSTFRRRGER